MNSKKRQKSRKRNENIFNVKLFSFIKGEVINTSSEYLSLTTKFPCELTTRTLKFKGSFCIDFFLNHLI